MVSRIKVCTLKMKTSAIVVIPSIWEEPFGLVAAEAMSNGAAVIASDIGGIPEIVKMVFNYDINKLKLENELVKLMSQTRKEELYKDYHGIILNVFLKKCRKIR